MCASATAQDLRIEISPVIEGHTDLRDFAKAAVVIGIAGTAYLGRRAFQDIRQSDIPPAVEIHIPQSAPEVSNIDQQG